MPVIAPSPRGSVVPCLLLAGLAAALGPGAADAATGGPDALGITWADGADGCPTDFPTFTAAAQTWIAPAGVIGPLPLGFPMPYAGGVVTDVWISPTGFVAFSDQGLAGASGVTQLLPDPAAPNHLVAPFWKPLPADQVDAEGFGDRFVVDWRRDEGAPALTPAFLTLFPDGRMIAQWAGGRFSNADATVGYEDAPGARGTTFWRDGSPVEPGFQQPMSGRSLCLTPPVLLDCASAAPAPCGATTPVDLPASLSPEAEVYSCGGGTFPGHERVVRVDLAAPAHLIVSIDDPACDLFRVASPPDCGEARCLDFADAVVDVPVAFAGSHVFVIDKATPGGGNRVNVEVACESLPEIACGASLVVTASEPTRELFYSCVPGAQPGPEAHARVVTAAPGHLAVTVSGAPPGTWVILREPDGTCRAAGLGGATLFDAAAGEWIVTTDRGPGVAGDFTISVACGTQLDCAAAQPAPCGGTIAGDTSRSTVDRASRDGCGSARGDGAEDTWMLLNPEEQVVSARFTIRSPGQELFLLEACDEGRCAFGPEQGSCALLPAGSFLLVVDGPEGSEGPYEVVLECLREASPGVDLRLAGAVPLGLETDCRDLGVDGSLVVDLVNDGLDDSAAPFDVVAFLDVNATGDFEPAADTALGQATVAAPVPGVGEAFVSVPVAGTLPFRGAPILAKVDPPAAVPDRDRGNHLFSTGSLCVLPGAAPSPIALRIEWAWTGSPVAPTFFEVESVPLVADLDGDGFPEVIFSAQETSSSPSSGSVLRAVSGRDGSNVWAADAPSSRLRVASAQAVGDLDGDGSPEIVGQSHDDPARLLCFDAGGALRWTSVPLPVRSPFDTYSGAPAIADLDGDGAVEVTWGPNALNGADGTLFWTPEAGGWLGTDTGGPMSIVVDVDGDGVQEIVAGPTAYALEAPTRTGRILWTRPDLPDGFTAAGNLDDDGLPEIVLVHPHRIVVLEGESGLSRWDRDLPVGGGGTCGGISGLAGGPPSIADVDADGVPEILVVVADWLACYERDGELKWSAPIFECSSGTTTATVFDLDGDGRKEVVHADEVAVRILDGETGLELASHAPHTSGTAREMPVVADVDADGQAEILIVENRLLGGSGVGEFGLRCLGSATSPWVGARALWNQHAYHVSNVLADLSVPAPSAVPCRAPSPLAAGSFRAQRPAPSTAPLAPNLTLTLRSATRRPGAGCADDLEVVVRAGSAGGRSPGVPTQLQAWDGDPVAGASILATDAIPDLVPGAWVDLTVRVPVPAGAFEVWLVADDDGTGAGIVAECREDDNACVVTDADTGAGTPPPADVGPALRATAHGDPYAADITADFDWSLDFGGPRVLGTGPGEQHYHVLRAVLGAGPPSFARIAGMEPWLSASFTDTTPRTPTAALPGVHGYLVVAADSCERESGE